MSKPIQCPECGSKARRQVVTMTTAAYYPPSFDDDGNLIINDHNQITTEWECAKCGEHYSTKE